ncbi:sortase A [Kineococcus xinjiangensis]|uniref:Sortase A n=1 Tax=Kineococcus xinjiangensis TaxID=512762 RepID=A0A2S6II95_9ACTN|nr:class E sortase [Kineococcus xinjiangensis]PPK93906.1 sortase A [Kineococcus xinjiangensis]
MSAQAVGPARPYRRSTLQAVASGLGEALLTLGVLVLLFVAWQLWWTDLTSGRAQQQTVEELQRAWQVSAPAQPEPAPAGAPGTAAAPAPGPSPAADTALPQGRAFAILHVPRFGEDYAVPVVEGTTAEVLKDGVGHYRRTAGPGEVGNFALAGHRVTYGRPFHDIAELREGDPVVVATATDFFTYRVRGHEIVSPSAVEVIAPVPNRPGAEPTERLLTMTACHPINSARQRYIVHAVLESVRPRADGPPPVLQRARS